MSREHPTRERDASDPERGAWAEACFRMERLEAIAGRLSTYLLRLGPGAPESWQLVMEALNLHDAMARALAHRQERRLQKELRPKKEAKKCRTRK